MLDRKTTIRECDIVRDQKRVSRVQYSTACGGKKQWFTVYDIIHDGAHYTDPDIADYIEINRYWDSNSSP